MSMSRTIYRSSASSKYNMIQIIEDNFDQNLFNRTATNPVQSWQWGESKKKLGIGVLKIGEFEENTLKRVFQITFHKIPHTSYTIGYLPRSTFPSKEVMIFLRAEATKRKAIFIKIEPYVRKDVNKNYQTPYLVKSSHPLFPSWTQMLDISRTEEDLMKNLKSKTRYNIRLAQKKGVTVREVFTDEGFDVFSKLYFETTKRQDYHGHDELYHKIVWNYMKKGIAHIVVAYYENVPLAAYELFLFNDVLYYPYGGTSELHRNLMASNLLMWETILLGKKWGAKTYDMWGSLPPDYDGNDPWSGFTRFKEGYGTEFVELVGSYDLIINKPLNKLYGIANRIRMKLL